MHVSSDGPPPAQEGWVKGSSYLRYRVPFPGPRPLAIPVIESMRGDFIAFLGLAERPGCLFVRSHFRRTFSRSHGHHGHLPAGRHQELFVLRGDAESHVSFLGVSPCMLPRKTHEGMFDGSIPDDGR